MYVSDGTNYLHFWNTDTFELLSKIPIKRRLPSAITVTYDSYVSNINELEYDHHTNTILANVWKQDYIIRINPNTGFVTHQYDLYDLVDKSVVENDPEAKHLEVLNGIAVTSEPNIIWVTGKNWNRMYKIRLISSSSSSGG